MTLTIIAIVFFHKYSEHMWNSQTNKQAFKSMVISTCSVRYWLFVMMTIDRLFFMMTIDRLFVMMTIYWLFVMMTIEWLFVMMTIDWLFVIMTIDWLFVILFFIYIIFSVRLLSVLRGHSVVQSPPQRPMTFDIEGFSIPDFIHYLYFPILILEKETVFPF